MPDIADRARSPLRRCLQCLAQTGRKYLARGRGADGTTKHLQETPTINGHHETELSESRHARVVG
ncbi:hypothetical protein [Rhodanobacter sp. 115]|uniref:hypothetical protein n=1 Tax=Rhodanobacter sp. FW021-MT20 TaxID=1162282 RepID=UPI00192C3FAF|nr:hypothetical protein [Rhodanobacter sp. 115]